ncbi:2-oxoglutarate dehydrogenase E1 component [Bdellovibrio svalbardensis]|uniref:oxoglutarate dehydrogenase (succinyl-transferring) n=1 Tax=Bdellovibrio svalbardensis TaxID=2972972 RepID=A0ABT6DHD3_9BACT|nr:2-oxoglutarate dehydrogenase E1 component [Bdellovibrio svalbardensis]MDG0815882.1 2-oxoglutarate dehydrogenase E1 component [Bdellovibrio svalbardensis]
MRNIVNNNGINSSNLEYIEQLYADFKVKPDSLAAEWRSFFEGVEFAQEGKFGMSDKELSVYQLIQAYRANGHLEADLNPLYAPQANDALALKAFNLSDKDLTAKFQIGSLVGKANVTLADIIAHLKKTYCGKIALQAADASPAEVKWLTQEFEGAAFKLSVDEKKNALTSLTKAESLEKFVHTRYVGTKRFSVEGADSMLPMMDTLVNKGSANGVKEMFVGMAHRGRVNMLVNFFGKSEEYVFGDFNGPLELEKPVEDFDNDVKYHLGYKVEKKTATGSLKATMAYNPSHLETVNAVALGMARAAQDKNGGDRKSVVTVLIHGDAAFAGQGIIQETMQLANVKPHTTGGTVHIVVDNQVGFTTSGKDTRSTRYASDSAKMTFTPVLHCNGDDVESCVRAADIAIRFRQQFGKDIVINFICYRKYGHNEGDEPAFTQPLMYDLIKAHATVRELYVKKLTAENSIDQKTADDLYQAAMDRLQQIYEDTKKSPPKLKNFKFEGNWAGLRKGVEADMEKPANTTFDLAKLKQIGEKIGSYPADFTPHPKLIKLLEARKNMGAGKEMIDWGMGELLAYGSLLSEGTSVRLTGEDCVRGTFTHRHAGMYDVKTNKCYFPLADLNPKAQLLVAESILSEYGVMGYEYGYSTQDPTSLVMWEAQFGDFVNGAQIVLDQYLAAAESKWQQMSGLVLLLPHGYEGQGPEHSSARLERFLQSCALYNMQVVNLTTPAQIYHALRRQVRRDFRKPLVVMTPKSLLRHPRAVSSIEDLAKGSFQEVIADTVDKSKVDTVVFVSGKLYYELLDEREKSKKENIALVRLEQLYPFPAKQVTEVLKSYPKAKTLIWAQEEPKNMGAFQNVYFKFVDVVQKAGLQLRFEYAGRPEKASPAVGSIHKHKVEQADIIKSIFN